MKTILLATNNPGKVSEIQEILCGTPVKLLTPSQLGLDLEIEENGSSYFENALLKGSAFSKRTGLPTLADDSGLEVEALNGKPGLHSRRFVPDPDANDLFRCLFLIDQLRKFPQPWKAAFHSEVVLVDQQECLLRSHGICQGTIIAEPQGSNGFGYDPIFVLNAYPATMAELPSYLKNQLSHRALALRAILTELHNFALS